MARFKGLVMTISILGLAVAMLAVTACADGEAATDKESSPNNNVSGAVIPAVGNTSPATDRLDSGVSLGNGSYYQVAGSQQVGIWVNGEGVIKVVPDLAVVQIGVETQATTVVEARNEAARAMDAIVAAVKAFGLTDKDIMTQSYNIYPRYEYYEQYEGGKNIGRQVLVGYTVSNNASIKVRNLDKVGQVIDAVASAGGDATRINGISFTVEDPKPYETNLRKAAVEDAMAKARQFATLTGVELGKLVYVAETSSYVSAQKSYPAYDMRESAGAIPAPTTSISGGELELTLSIQAVFDIQ